MQVDAGPIIQGLTMRNNCPPEELSAYERMLFRLVARGLRDSEIASELGYNERQVEQSVSLLARRLGAEDRLELTLLALAIEVEATDSKQEEKLPDSDDRSVPVVSTTDTESQA